MPVFLWMELDYVSLKGSAMSSNLFWDVNSMVLLWAASLLIGWVVFLLC